MYKRSKTGTTLVLDEFRLPIVLFVPPADNGLSQNRRQHPVDKVHPSTPTRFKPASVGTPSGCINRSAGEDDAYGIQQWQGDHPRRYYRTAREGSGGVSAGTALWFQLACMLAVTKCLNDLPILELGYYPGRVSERQL